MNNPLISIVTINFNNASGLRKTLESVQKQKFSDYEHIIVDGNSTDESVNVIKEFLNDENYAKHVTWWCSEKDKGIYNAMNKGIVHTNGMWIYILNSGDILVQDVFNQVQKFLINNELKIIYGAVDCIVNDKFVNTACLSADYLDQGMIPHQGTFIPKKLHDEIGFYDESFKILADRDLMLKMKNSGIEFSHIPVIIALYDGEGVSSSNSKILNQENNRIIKKYNLKKEKISIKIFKSVIKLLLPGFLLILIKFVIKVLKDFLKRT